MQLLTRRVLMNLTKSSLQASPTKFNVLSAAALKKRNDEAIQNYSAETVKSGKQTLLRFPALSLEETMPKFLKTCEPLLGPADMQVTKMAVEEFMKCDGPKLQELLEKAAQKEENWLAGRWQKVAYLQWRDPVTVYCSPGMAFPLRSPFTSDCDYFQYVSKVIYCLIQYKLQVDRGEIPVAKMGEFELDNSQFGKVFGTCRIPALKEDKIEYYPKSKHVVVIYKNHFYKLAVINEDGKALHTDVLDAELQKIFKKECEKGVEFGLLSTERRDNWVEAYEALFKIEENQESICAIQQSLFTVSLDDAVKSEGNRLNMQAEQLIHGGGSSQNSGNRWMDKTIQLIINRNGSSGFCYEHSPAEGQPIALMTDYVIQNLRNKKLFEGGAKDKYECVYKLPLKLNKCIEDLYLPEARRHIDRLVGDLKVHIMHFKQYGKGFMKAQKLSPDSFIQIALQYAFYMLHKEPGAQYESAHLRIFVNGRTETIRSCSCEALTFAEAMLDSKAKKEKKIELLRKAVKGHRAYTTMALQGKGIDRHLLGLKLMALENKMPVPKFYSSPGFQKSAYFRVSTSQVASKFEAWMAYGPSVNDGYACCYNPRENDIFLCMSSWNRCDGIDVDLFAASVKKALEDMYKLLFVDPCAKL